MTTEKYVTPTLRPIPFEHRSHNEFLNADSEYLVLIHDRLHVGKFYSAGYSERWLFMGYSDDYSSEMPLDSGSIQAIWQVIR